MIARWVRCSADSLMSSRVVSEAEVLAEHSGATPGGASLFLRQDAQEGLEHHGDSLPEEGRSPANGPQPGGSGATHRCGSPSLPSHSAGGALRHRTPAVPTRTAA